MTIPLRQTGLREASGGLPAIASAEHQEVREAFVAIVERIQKILETQPPEAWWRMTYRVVRKEQAKLETYDPRIRAFFADRLVQMVEVLRAETEREDRDEPEARTLELVHALADIVAKPEHSADRLVMRKVSIEQLLKDAVHFDHAEKLGEDGVTRKVLRIRAHPEAPWSDVVLPSTTQMWHKGGAPRVTMKILAHAPLGLIETELPPNDFDVVAFGDDKTAQQEAVELGVDLEGVEMLHEWNPEQIMKQRDMDLNQCLLGKEGLIYSTRGLQAALTGEVNLIGEDRGLYGTETFVHDKVRLVKNRGLFRLIKFVAEGKAKSFPFTPLNEQVDFGVYWLVLARKFARKKNAGQLLNRMYELGKRTGQVREGEEDIYAVLERVHAENSFFKFTDTPLDKAGVAKWLARKLGRFAERQFRKEQRVATDVQFERHPQDTVPYLVSLDGFEDDEAWDAETAERWETFASGADARVLQQQAA